MTKENDQRNSGGARFRRLMAALVAFGLLGGGAEWAVAQGTALGEIEGRAAPVARRKCIAGANAGKLCNENADCPGSTCRDRNVFNLSVAVHYDASAADLTAIEGMISAGSAALFDITDGQAEIGQAVIHNNSTGAAGADVRIYPATCTNGSSIGAVCAVHADCPDGPDLTTNADDGRCGVWWSTTSAGSWKVGGNIAISINWITGVANPGPIFAHEFTHFVFDARDEYEGRPACGPNTTPGEACPDAAAGQPACLMDGNGTELCWGHGDPANLTDMTGGNHDATDITEQSQCRNNRSCWDQVVWSWPTVFTKPAAVPNPAAGGAAVNATYFVRTSDVVRVVLVLDESYSMILESPSRLERLKVAAKDFVALAEDDAELGIVSYSTDAEVASGRVVVDIDALGANRAAWNNAIDGLGPSNNTSIGAGLQKARDMIMAEGGVTANTYIVLMTDGLNNEPAPQANADADLTAKLATLLADGIEVYVTCTGSDIGLASQCSEIAAGTGGHYTDSADASTLPQAFADFHELINGREAVDSITGDLGKLLQLEGTAVRSASEPVGTFYIEPGSQTASFLLQWTNPAAMANMLVRDPDGNEFQTREMPQGRFLRVENPTPGDWEIVVGSGGGVSSPFVARAYVRNPANHLSTGVRYPSVIPSSEIYVYAYPVHMGLSLTSDRPITAKVIRPDGSADSLELYDLGRDPAGNGDDMPGDGVFTGVYQHTGLTGPYQFVVQADVSEWQVSSEAHEHENEGVSGRFTREERLSAAVDDPNAVETTPEDPPTGAPSWCDRWMCWILIVLLLLVLLNLLIVWRCCRRARSLIAARAGG